MHQAGHEVRLTVAANMNGSLDEDGQVGRHILVHAVPHAGTYALMFAGWGPGDARDKTPPWDGKTIVVRLVTVGDHDELFFDGDFRPPFAATSARCT